MAEIISRISYSGILFLPPFCGQFIYFAGSGKTSRFLDNMYILSFVLLPFLWFTDLFISGVWHYKFGFYPKCHYLHLVHVGQGFVVIIYCFIKLIKELYTDNKRKKQIKSALISFSIFIFAAPDYIVKHGIEYYPVGWFFVSSALGFTLYKTFFSSFADLSILTNRLQNEIEKEKAKSLYLVKVFAHDIKNRLSSGMISLYSAQIKDGHNKYIEQSLNDQKHMNRMVGNLINVFMDDQIILNKKTINIDDLIKDFEKEWALKFEDKNITFTMRNNSVKSINIDPAYMELVFENLFANALQHSPTQGSFSLVIKATTEQVWLEFSNSGETIPKEYENTIFKKYLSPGKHSPYNKGLGLNYSKMMAERHKGKLEYTINKNGHNTFTLTIPN